MFMSSESLLKGKWLPVPGAERFRRFKIHKRTSQQAAPRRLPQKVMQRWRICLFLPPFLRHCDWERERQRGERQVSLLPPPPPPARRRSLACPPAPDLREKREEVTANNRLSSTSPQTFPLCSWLTWEWRWQDAHGWRHHRHTSADKVCSFTHSI